MICEVKLQQWASISGMEVASFPKTIIIFLVEIIFRYYMHIKIIIHKRYYIKFKVFYLRMSQMQHVSEYFQILFHLKAN